MQWPIALASVADVKVCILSFNVWSRRYAETRDFVIGISLAAHSMSFWRMTHNQGLMCWRLIQSDFGRDQRVSRCCTWPVAGLDVPRGVRV